MNKFMFSAGEVSADVHGANLAKKLFEIDPTLQIFGVGGERMKAVGVDVKYNISNMNLVGVCLIERLRRLMPLIRVGNQITKMMREEKPDIVILIAGQGFNTTLAKRTKALGIPTAYYFAPEAWRLKVYQLGEKVVKDVMETVDHVFAVFPGEYEAYKKWGDNVTYVGYPDLETIKPTKVRNDIFKSLEIEKNRKVIGLFPGSRWQEVRRLLPTMLRAAERIHSHNAEIEFVVSISAEFLEEYIIEQVDKFSFISTTRDLSYNLMSICDLVIACSGTITIEAAAIGVPMIVVYKTSFLTFNIGKLILNSPYISLPNIIAQKKIVPELLQQDVSPHVIARSSLKMIADPLNQKIRDDLAEVRNKLSQKKNALDNSSKIIFQMINGKKPE